MFDLFSGALALSTTVAADKEARYSRAGERPTGSGVIRITVYGSTMKEVMTRFEKMKNEKHITADEPLVEQIGKSAAHGKKSIVHWQTLSHSPETLEVKRTTALDVPKKTLDGFSK